MLRLQWWDLNAWNQVHYWYMMHSVYSSNWHASTWCSTGATGTIALKIPWKSEKCNGEMQQLISLGFLKLHVHYIHIHASIAKNKKENENQPIFEKIW